MNIPGCKLLEKVGEGATGIVWKAHQISLDRIVAVKVLRPRFAVNPDEVKDFIHEARSAAKLKHPNIIQVYDVAEERGTYYFIMEFVAGPTLAQLIKQRGRIPQKEALKVALHTAQALENAWIKARIIHRDIKPDNIMFDDDGSVKLADLGLAKMADPAKLSAQIEAGALEGTPNYMSPEQASSARSLDYRTDMYSLGATLYHLVTGNVPFGEHGPMDALNRHINGFLPNPRDIDPSVHLCVVNLITRLMMKNPNDRYKDWDEAIKAIKKAASGRLLLVTKPRANAVSTIEPQKTASTSDEKSVEAATPVPPWIRTAVWTLLWAWWIFLAHSLLSPQRADRPDRADMPKTTKKPEIIEQLLEMEQDAPPESVESDAQARTSDIAAEEEDSLATPMEENVEPSAEYDINALKLTVTEHLIAEDFEKALSVIREQDGSGSFKGELASLLEFVADVAKMNSLIESGFNAKIGQEVAVQRNGRTHVIIPRAIAGGRANALVIKKNADAAQTNSVTYTISQMEPSERRLWLGAANNPAKCAMKFILYMQEQDYMSARTFASNAGPLSEAFAKAIEPKLGQTQ